MKRILKTAVLAASLLAGYAQATLVATPSGPFLTLDDAFTAEIVSTNSQGSVGIGFMPDGRLLRNDGFGNLFVHSAVADTTVNGANTIRSSTVLGMSGDIAYGYGIALGDDGYVYAQSFNGLKKIDPVSGASVATAGAAGTYGIKKQPSGMMVYNSSDGWVHQYDPVTNTDAAIYNSGSFNDDISVAPDGYIFVAVLGACRTDILKPDGTFVRSSSTGICADGMAYGQGKIYKNNTDGSLTRLSYAGANYTGAETEELVADWSGYGDLAAVGPDNAFYINGYGFNYPNGAYADAWTVVRISLVDGGGFGNEVPEPETLALALTALAGLAWTRRRRVAA